MPPEDNQSRQTTIQEEDYDDDDEHSPLSGLFTSPNLESRARIHKTLGIASAFFAALAFIIALTGSSQIFLIVSLYGCIILAGLFLTMFFLSSRVNWDLTKSMSGRFEPFFEGKEDVVSSIAIYVKYAAKGSSHSRTEIAYILRNILAREIELNPRSRFDSTSEDPQFKQDLQRVIYDYTVSSQIKNSSQRRRKRSFLAWRRSMPKQEREAYVTSLERLIKRLEDKGAPTTGQQQ